MSKVKSITTKTGDKGTSSLFSGEKVSKSSLRLDTYGDIDEMVTILSLARHHVEETHIKADILTIQRELFIVASELATTAKKLERLPQRVDKSMLQHLEDRCVILEARVELPDGFVIPGESIPSTYIDLARAVCRRCERKAVSLFEKKEIENAIVLIWLNRLSDYLYLLARFIEKKPLLVKASQR